MKLFLLFPFLALALASHAEYRVFTLRISKKNSDPAQPSQQRTVQSTLDPVQYKGYYPIEPDEMIEYTDTWMCRGRTNNQTDFCPNPKKAQIQEAAVSNSSAP